MITYLIDDNSEYVNHPEKEQEMKKMVKFKVYRKELQNELSEYINFKSPANWPAMGYLFWRFRSRQSDSYHFEFVKYAKRELQKRGSRCTAVYLLRLQRKWFQMLDRDPVLALQSV